MIGVDGQYVASISIGNDRDFLEEDDLIEFAVIEEAGNVLPTFILNFKSTNEKILAKLNEGQTIEAKLGRDLESLNEITLSTSKLKTAKEGEDERYYEAMGFASNIDYITNHNLQITTEKSGIAAALEVLGNNFDIESDVTTSNDSQRWIQHNITDKQFVNNCLMHSDMGDNFPAFAITADGKFILRDLLKSSRSFRSGSQKWRFTREAIAPNDILYDGDPVITSQAGFINNWIGYGRKTLAINPQSGLLEEVLEEPTTLLSLSDAVDKAMNIETRFNGTQIISDNTHENYWSSYNHNLQALANLSKVEVALSFSNDFRGVKPLDLVMFSENSNESENQAGEIQSGLYVISKVVRQVMGKRLTTTVLLNREAFNNIRNA